MRRRTSLILVVAAMAPVGIGISMGGDRVRDRRPSASTSVSRQRSEVEADRGSAQDGLGARAPLSLRIIAPTTCRPGRGFPVRFVLCDQSGTPPAQPYTGPIEIAVPPGMTGLPERLVFQHDDDSVLVQEGVTIGQEGIYRIRARRASSDVVEPWLEGNPTVCREDDRPSVRWGSLRGDGSDGPEGGRHPEAYLRDCRRIGGLDFAGLSMPIDLSTRSAERRGDRAESSPNLEVAWNALSGAVRAANGTDRFTAIAGVTIPMASLGSVGAYFKDGLPGWSQLSRLSSVVWPWDPVVVDGLRPSLMIAHLDAASIPYTALGVRGRGSVSILECYSSAGMSFPGYGVTDPVLGGVTDPRAMSLFRVAGRGLSVGLAGDGGAASGLPGIDPAVGAPHGSARPPGLTAVLTDGTTAEALIDAYHRRRVYATSGARIYLDVRIGGAGMGEVHYTDHEAKAVISVAGTSEIRYVNLFDGERVRTQFRPTGKRDLDLSVSLGEPAAEAQPFLVEVIQADGHRAWSSPIWVRRRSLPDLRWERTAKGRAVLVNGGSSAARSVTVVGHPSACPFLRPFDEPYGPIPDRADAALRVVRYDDTRALVFVQYRRLEGHLTITGLKAIQAEAGRSSPEGAGPEPVGGGRWRLRAGADTRSWQTACFDVTIGPRKPAALVLEIGAEQTVWLQGAVQRGRKFRMPLNGMDRQVTSRTLRLPLLKPGGRWEMPVTPLIWAADPDGRIAESNEGNNLYTPPARR